VSRACLGIGILMVVFQPKMANEKAFPHRS
jgi:hypothetical protein